MEIGWVVSTARVVDEGQGQGGGRTNPSTHPWGRACEQMDITYLGNRRKKEREREREKEEKL